MKWNSKILHNTRVFSAPLPHLPWNGYAKQTQEYLRSLRRVPIRFHLDAFVGEYVGDVAIELHEMCNCTLFALICTTCELLYDALLTMFHVRSFFCHHHNKVKRFGVGYPGEGKPQRGTREPPSYIPAV